MNYLKLVTIFNWLIVGLLFLLVMAETLFPARGGDAASVMGKGIYYMAIIVLVLLIILNFLPFKWSKHAAFALVVIPLLWAQFEPTVGNIRRTIVNIIQAKPFFEDSERNKMARAIFDGKADKLKKLIADAEPRLRDNAYGYPLLAMAVKRAAFDDGNSEARLECVRALLKAGVPIRSNDPDVERIHYEAAFHGNPRLLRVLLENGADANARVTDYGSGKRNVVPIIFEALSTPYGAYQCVEALLAHGADANAIKSRDGDHRKMSVLLYAAERQRWDVCKLLLNNGADLHYITPDSISVRTFIDQGENFYHEDEKALADFEFVRALLQ